MSYLLCRFLEFGVLARSVTSDCAKPEKSSNAQAQFNVLGSEIVILNPP